MEVVVVVEADPMDPSSAAQLEKALTDNKDTDSGHWSGDATECVGQTQLQSTCSSVTDDDVDDSDLSGEEDAHEDELRIEIASLAESTRPDSPGVQQASALQLQEEDCCIICFEEKGEDTVFDDSMWDYERVPNYILLPCCRRVACKQCMKQIVITNVEEGRVKISCPHPKCGKVLPKQLVLTSMVGRPYIKANYTMLCLDVEGDGTKKTCPNCCEITEHHLPKLRRLTERELKIQCTACNFEWCFRCQAPWHDGVSCKQFKKGDKHFKEWSQGRRNGVANCQKCPTCRVNIQRSTGCPHMTCSRCDSHFCYDCGGRFLEFDPIIDHKSDNLEVWGCPDIYLPNEPVKRKFIRGGWLGTRITFLAGYPVLLVGAAVLVVAGGAIALPIYGGYKLYRYHKNKIH